MSGSIPPRGSIPVNVRGGKQVQRRKLPAWSQETRCLSVRLGMGKAKRSTTVHPADIPEPYCIPSKTTTTKGLRKGTLEKLLTWGQQEEQRCINVLRTLSPEFHEYDEVLERLGKLQQVLDQVKRQLIAGK
jgi:hypothetical protein